MIIFFDYRIIVCWRAPRRLRRGGLHARYILDCDRRIPGIARVSTTTGYHVVSTPTGTKSPLTTEPTHRRNQKPI